MVLLGELCPIAAEIISIKLAIIGNWNELYQAELQEPDFSVTVHSKMFADFRQKLYEEWLVGHKLNEDIPILDIEEHKGRTRSFCHHGSGSYAAQGVYTATDPISDLEEDTDFDRRSNKSDGEYMKKKYNSKPGSYAAERNLLNGQMPEIHHTNLGPEQPINNSSDYTKAEEY